MPVNYDYMELPYDLSGAMSKNRFRNEMLWGLKKIFELHKSSTDYVVVFDYVCDVEVHLREHYEYYQIKTQNNNEPYKLNKLYRKTKGNSILGKLYLLRLNKSNEECEDIKVAVVLVNDRPFYAGKNNYRIYSFFRDEKQVYGTIQKPTGKVNTSDSITLEGSYPINWMNVGRGKYYIISIK